MSEITDLNLKETIEHIKSKKVSSEEVTKSYINNIEK